MEIYKCDRCGQITDDLTRISTSIPKPETYQEKEQENPFSFFPFGISKTSNTVSLELCNDCLKILVRWLSHPENFLMKMQELKKKNKTGVKKCTHK